MTVLPEGKMPKKIIGLDNGKYSVIILQADNEEEEANRVKDICSIHTGIGGYMPRYEQMLIERDSKFSLITMC